MPAVVNKVTNRVELPSSYEWSWPDHPDEMNDSDARMRAGRTLPEHLTTQTRLEDADLAVAYGKLLEEGKAGIQQTLESGDSLPRETDGLLLKIKQQMAIELAEARNGMEVGVYATSPVGDMEEAGPVPERWGATDEHFLATWVPSEKNPDSAVEVIRHNDAARTSLHTRGIASCIGTEIDDYGAAWRAAIERGRSIEAPPHAPDMATARAPERVQTAVVPEASGFSISIEKRTVIASGPIRTDSEAGKSCDQLYAHVRGTLAAAYGDPSARPSTRWTRSRQASSRAAARTGVVSGGRHPNRNGSGQPE